MTNQDKLGPDERHHDEAPAEGTPAPNPGDTRAHAEAPAEGAADQDKYTDDEDDDGAKDQ